MNEVLNTEEEGLDKLNCQPIYLGYDPVAAKYWFYALKEGRPRFLAYVAYFFWDKGPQAPLELKEIPEEINKELIEFLKGNVTYGIRLTKTGRKKLEKAFRLPTEVGDGGRNVPRPRRRDRESPQRISDTSGGNKPQTQSGGVLPRTERKRQELGTKLDKHVVKPVVPATPATPALKGAEPKVEPPGAEIVKPRKKGRPKGSKNEPHN